MSETSMLSSTIVYLGAAVVCVPAAKALRLGSVLGYLAAGCVIGPFGLGLIEDPAATLRFAEIGVVLMLFVIGLELDIHHLWTLRRAVFGGGTAQLVAAAVPLGLGALALGLPWQAALVTGLSLGLSSTAVSMQIMGEKNLLPTPVGRTAFAVLLFQDIAAIPLLGLVPFLAQASAGEAPGRASGLDAVAVLKVLGAVVTVVVIGRFLTRPLLRIVARTGQREVFSAFTLLLVLGIAALMASVGISMALGAFLAGVLLAGSEYRHALETDIEPFRGLLMGLFFIAVGMSVDFGLLAREPLMMALIVLGFQLFKGLALAAIARLIGVSSGERWLFAALLAQGGEFAFVVFGVARSARLLPGTWDARLTLAVALSMALTPVLLILHDRWKAKSGAQTEREPDAIEDPHAPVIIAGFGRFGQIVGRLLFASGVKATVLDHDPDRIESLRAFGFKVHYGDATRIDLLRAAGADKARLFVLAVDDPDTSVRLVETLKENFPKLPIVSRARDVSHWQRLRALDIAVVERETFESAILVGRRALESLGVRPYEARERADLFRNHNVRTLEEMLPSWEDERERTSRARSAREQLEQQMKQDRADVERQAGRGWHSDEVKAELPLSGV
ncbi:MAG TPA: glutathione-regulated potassium-efflux system protein KefC [Polyangiaceae bacterium]|nr:glutathione-regulated potassium-efflux system protein KefC [Polyangiaceae bacterium]